MASKKSAKKTTKKTTSKNRHYPVVRGSFLGSTVENQTVRIFDTAAALSRLNRRLYRFARVYPVSISLNASATGNVEVYALRDDWAIHKGVQMAYKMYMDNVSEERKALGSNQIARWEDFRVDHGVPVVNTIVPALHDAAFAPVLQTEGEFDNTQVVDSSNTTRTFTFGTPTATEFGILQEYDKSANAQESPNVLSGAAGQRLPYSELDSEMNQDTGFDLQTNGNEPPYDRDGVNADSPWVKIAVLGAGAAGQQKLSTGFFNAPCGLVVLVGSGATWSTDACSFEVKRGDYKGVGGLSLLE